MRFSKYAATIPALALVFSAGAASATPLFDQDVTPEFFNGSGNDNGSFTVDRQNGIELGLRGKLRFNDSNLPENTFNSNGDGTYTFQNGTPDLSGPNLPGWASNTTPIWSFEWSINSDYDSTGANLDAFDYLLQLDKDPGAGTEFVSAFDPINGFNPGTSDVQWDHTIGDNVTGNGQGSKIPNSDDDASGYANLIANNNVAQQSWTYEFFNDAGGPTFGFDPNVAGEYLIRLSALDQGVTVASTEITINAVAPVPVPAALPLLLAGLGGLGLVARRKRKAA